MGNATLAKAQQRDEGRNHHQNDANQVFVGGDPALFRGKLREKLRPGAKFASAAVGLLVLFTIQTEDAALGDGKSTDFALANVGQHGWCGLFRVMESSSMAVVPYVR